MPYPRLSLLVLAVLVILAHFGLWTSERMPDEMKWRLTLLNALGWGVVLLPAVGVRLWLAARRRQAAERN